MSNEPESPGGWGEGHAPDLRTTRLHERAIRERWPIGAPNRVKVLKRLCAIVDEDTVFDYELGKPGHREVISAARALLAADRINLDEQKLDLAREQRDAGKPADEAGELSPPETAAVVRAIHEQLTPPGLPQPPAGDP